jgi:hypothetical protein
VVAGLDVHFLGNVLGYRENKVVPGFVSLPDEIDPFLLGHNGTILVIAIKVIKVLPLGMFISLMINMVPI